MSASAIRLRARALTRLNSDHLDPFDGLGEDDFRIGRPDEESWLIEPEGAEPFALRRFRWRTPNHSFDDANPSGSLIGKGEVLLTDGWLDASRTIVAPLLISSLARQLPMPAFEGWDFTLGPELSFEFVVSDAERRAWERLLELPFQLTDPAELALAAVVEALLLNEACSAGEARPSSLRM